MTTTKTTTDFQSAALAAVRPFVPRKALRPILKHAVRRVTTHGVVMIGATDLDAECVVQFTDPAAAAGETVLDPKTAADTGDDPMEFPHLGGDGSPTTGSAAVPWRTIRRVADLVVPATDNESSRFALGGVLVESARVQGLIDFVGTDGKRMHVVTGEPSTISGTVGGIVPAEFWGRFTRAVRWVARAGFGHGGKRLDRDLDCTEVSVRFTADTVVFTWEGPGATVTARARLLQARFPKWAGVFDRAGVDARTATRIDAGEVADGMREAAGSIKAHQKALVADGQHIEFTPDGRRGVEFKADGTVVAACGATVWSDHIGGTMPTAAIFDPAFLAEALDGVVEFDGGGSNEWLIDCESANAGLMGASFVFGGAWRAGGYGFAAAVMPMVQD